MLNELWRVIRSNFDDYLKRQIVDPLQTTLENMTKEMRTMAGAQEQRLKDIVSSLAGVRGIIGTIITNQAELQKKLNELKDSNPDLEDELSELASLAEGINGDLGTTAAALGVTTPAAVEASNITPEVLPALPPEVVEEAEGQVSTAEGEGSESGTTDSTTPI